MTKKHDLNLVKILYIIPEGEAGAGQGESLWAFSLGNQLYELQNIPVYADHLNVGDIVHCDELSDTIPIIQELVARSGNRTLRLIFKDETPDDICIGIMNELSQRNILCEKVATKRFMFNIPPTSDYAWAQDFLKTKEEGLLWLYEQAD